MKKDISKGYTQSSRDGFYNSKEWLSLRSEKLKLNPLCEECEVKGKLIPATVVNHIQPVTQFPDLKLNIDNLESLCRKCHDRRTRLDNSKYNRLNLKQGRDLKRDLDNFNND